MDFLNVTLKYYNRMLGSGYNWLLVFITIFTLVLQFYVIYLMQTKSTKQIQSYRYLLTLLMVTFPNLI